MRDEDVRFDSYTASGLLMSMTATHLPSGETVRVDVQRFPTQSRAMQEALRMLRACLEPTSSP